MKIMVLGCGPAGLMAAQAALDATREAQMPLEIAIASKRQKSPLYGAQYLHKPIPGITPTDVEYVAQIDYQLMGDAGDYRRKVYGSNWDGKVSPEDLAEPHLGWDIRETYDCLWDRWLGCVTDTLVDATWINENTEDADLVINSIPRKDICQRKHMFGWQEVWAAGDAPDLGIRIPYSCPANTVVCNGEDSPAWYRMSNVFGHKTVEWPGSIQMVPVKTAARVGKPTYHDCDCWPNILHVGRFGTWEKGVLSHTAYDNTYSRVLELSGVKDEAK